MAVNHDYNRSNITGISEVILAEPKSNKDLREAILRAFDKANKVLITRINQEQHVIIDNLVKDLNVEPHFDDFKRTCILDRDTPPQPQTDLVAIISAGTSDRYVVEEISMTLRFFEVSSVTYQDVGVAGIHRHQDVLSKLTTMDNVRMLIVVAGNEGALFSVIASQTKLPIIAVPTSIGYGFGGKGMTAFQSAVQSCSPGIAVVNIDNGFGAATFAVKLINSIASG